MNEKNKKCWSCGRFDAYYIRGFCCLLKESIGFCREHDKIVEKSNTCDKWYCKRTSKEQRIKIAMRSLPEIYNKIATLEQILMEESEILKIRNDIDTTHETNIRK